MMELTKEHFDKSLKGIDKRLDGMDKRFDGVDKQFQSIDKRFEGADKQFQSIDKRFDGVATKDDLKIQTKELKAFAVEQTEELARIVKGGFDDVLDRLDVRERMAIMEKKMAKIEQALHMEIEA